MFSMNSDACLPRQSNCDKLKSFAKQEPEFCKNFLAKKNFQNFKRLKLSFKLRLKLSLGEPMVVS